MVANIVDEEGEALECLFQLRLNGCVVQHFLMGLDKRLHPFLLFLEFMKLLLSSTMPSKGLGLSPGRLFGSLSASF